MKKWHMESIVDISEIGDTKLAVQDSPRNHSWETISAQESEEEFPLKQVCRQILTFFVKFF